MANYKRPIGCDKVGYPDLERMMGELSENSKKQPSIHQVWLYVESKATLQMLLDVMHDCFLFNREKAQDFAISAIDNGRVLCCSLPKDIAETKAEEINILCAEFGDVISCVTQRSCADVVRKA